MSKRVYISADYSQDHGDRDVVEVLNRWGNDNWHIVDFVDMARVVSGSVSMNPDCRPCELKDEFNRQINASSAVIFVVGDKTASRTAGSACYRNVLNQDNCACTPYKHNSGGVEKCKMFFGRNTSIGYDVDKINTYSYLRHEFEQAKRRSKTIIIVYNSLYNQPSWLPSYMKGYESCAFPFWVRDWRGNRVGNYSAIKEALGYE